MIWDFETVDSIEEWTNRLTEEYGFSEELTKFLTEGNEETINILIQNDISSDINDFLIKGGTPKELTELLLENPNLDIEDIAVFNSNIFSGLGTFVEGLIITEQEELLNTLFEGNHTDELFTIMKRFDTDDFTETYNFISMLYLHEILSRWVFVTMEEPSNGQYEEIFAPTIGLSKTGKFPMGQKTVEVKVLNEVSNIEDSDLMIDDAMTQILEDLVPTSEVLGGDGVFAVELQEDLSLEFEQHTLEWDEGEIWIVLPGDFVRNKEY